jgi:hypothetical protein
MYFGLLQVAPSSTIADADVAIVQPTMEPPPPYTPAATTSWNASAAGLAASEELRRRQEELERKAAELQRREDEIQRNMQFQGQIKLIFCHQFKSCNEPFHI